MRWTVFANPYRVVRENEDRRDLHQRGQTHARPHVIAKVEERRSEGAKARHRHAIHARTHHVLTDAEMQIPPRIATRLKISRTLKFQRGLIRSCQVSRS